MMERLLPEHGSRPAAEHRKAMQRLFGNSPRSLAFRLPLVPTVERERRETAQQRRVKINSSDPAGPGSAAEPIVQNYGDGHGDPDGRPDPQPAANALSRRIIKTGGHETDQSQKWEIEKISRG